MTLPPVIRVFFALDLPEETKAKIGNFITALKKKSRSHGIRWTKPANLHITLQFLGEMQTEKLPYLIEKVKKEIAEVMHHTHIELGGLHLFPSPYRPRVIVLEITPQEELAVLSQRIGKGIIASDYPIDGKPFRAHLTLGRIKHAQTIDLSFLSTFEPLQADSLPIEEVILFRSEPQPEGSQYTILEKIPLRVKARANEF